MGSRPALHYPAPCGALLLCLLAATAARAQAPPAERAPAIAAPRLTIETTRWPAAAPDGRPHADATDLALRWWLRRGAAQVGFGVGAVGRPAALQGEPGMPAIAWSASTLSLGLRWRLGARSMLYADASDARAAAPGGDLYATRLGVEWARAPSRFGFEKGAFGLRLDSGYRMSLRLRHGGLGIYLRSRF